MTATITLIPFTEFEHNPASVFHRVTDASKVAMVALMQWVEREGITLVDVQVITPHTARMGAVEVPRDEYLSLLRDAVQ